MKENTKLKPKNASILLILTLVIFILVALHSNQKSLNPTLAPSGSTLPILTADEKFILNPPPADASKSALQRHAQMVSKLAKDSSTLTVSNCQPDPLVLKTKQGSDIQIKNRNNKELAIIVDSMHIFKIPPNNSLVVKAQFKYGPGDYGYICDGIKLAGFMHIL